jgi:hypothetical protein
MEAEVGIGPIRVRGVRLRRCTGLCKPPTSNNFFILTAGQIKKLTRSARSSGIFPCLYFQLDQGLYRRSSSGIHRIGGYDRYLVVIWSRDKRLQSATGKLKLGID